MVPGKSRLTGMGGLSGSFGRILLLAALLSLPSCDATATGPEDKRVGPDGGVARLEDGAIQLLVPAGALDDEVWFTAFPAVSVPSSPLLVPGTAWEVGPTGTAFSRPITVTLSYDPTQLPENVGEEGLALFQVLGGQWFLLEYGSVDVTTNTVSGRASGLGRFGVKGVELKGMEISPGATVLAPGSTVQLSASPMGEDGRTLTSQPVTWASSDTAVARVDGTGTVTGISEGTATITASSGSFSADAEVEVRIPVASVVVSPAWGSVKVGETLQLSTTPLDASGTPLTGRLATWSSSNLDILTVDSAGLVLGRSLGSATVTATVEGIAGMATFQVNGGLAVVTEALAPAQAGVTYAQTLAATGGNGTYQWALVSGLIPPGLSLNPLTGAISGIPSGSGDYAFAVQVTSAGQRAQGDLSIQVTPAPVASVALAPASAALVLGDSVPFSATARDASGRVLTGRATVWSSSDEEVATVSTEGVVAGVGEGSATISVTVDGFPAWASVSVRNLLTITDSILADGLVSVPYADTLSALGGDGRYTWSLVEDTLPTGLALTDSTGVVWGTPMTADSSDLRVAVESGDGQADTVRVTLVIRSRLTITTTALADGAEAVPYADTLRAAGGRSPYRWSIRAGSLPAGLVLDAATGAISGTPTASGTPFFTVEVTSEDQQTDTLTLPLAVQPAPVASVSVTPASVTLVQGQTQQLTATTRDAGGSILIGRTVNWATGSSGIARVSGTGLVTAEGVGTTTITALSEGVTGSSVITVHAVLAITNATLGSGAVGVAYEETLAASGGDGVYTWTVVGGALPAGLSLEGSTGTISGVPAGAGTSGFTVQVTSGDGQTATKALAIIVS